jgi:hypothetical protein
MCLCVISSIWKKKEEEEEGEEGGESSSDCVKWCWGQPQGQTGLFSSLPYETLRGGLTVTSTARQREVLKRYHEPRSI